MRSRWVLGIALVVGLVVRIGVLWSMRRRGVYVVDERQFARLAINLLDGLGLAWGPGDLTSIRPPLYPAFIASIWWFTGVRAYQAVRLVQVALGALTAICAYMLGSRMYEPRVGRYAAAICWLYPSLIFFNFVFFTETLFTFLLVAHVLLAVMLVQAPRAWTALGCGLALGLATLTRSSMFPTPVLLAPLLFLGLRATARRRASLVGLVVVGYLAAVGPWAVRNTRLQHVLTIVDTMGGMNLRMGNYEHTPSDRMWDAVSLKGPASWSAELWEEAGAAAMTEGQIDRWAQRKALAYMVAHPGVTLRRSLTKFADFWGLEREYIAGVRQRLYRPPAWFAVASAVLVVLGYIFVVVVGATGIWLAPPRDTRVHVLALLPIVLITAIHTIVFGHSRYHVPLMPILGVYGAALLARAGRASEAVDFKPVLAAAASILVLVGIWIEQIVLVDSSRIQSWLDRVL